MHIVMQCALLQNTQANVITGELYGFGFQLFYKFISICRQEETGHIFV
jgi:hypothetical protein